MRERSEKKTVTALLLTAMFFVAGCAKKEADPASVKDTLTIRRDGSVEAVISGTFDKAYYSEAELAESVEAELNRYNAEKGEERIRLLEHHADQGTAGLTLLFADPADCAEYLGIDLYVGDVQGAYDAGYDPDAALIDRRNEDRVIGKNDLRDMADRRIVICSGNYEIICPDTIDYYSFGCELISKTRAAMPEEEEEPDNPENYETILIY